VAEGFWVKFIQHKGIWRSGNIPPLILNFGTRSRWVVNFTPWWHYLLEKMSPEPKQEEAGWPHRWCGHFGKEKYLIHAWNHKIFSHAEPVPYSL